MYPCRKALRPARGPDDEPPRAARCGPNPPRRSRHRRRQCRVRLDVAGRVPRGRSRRGARSLSHAARVRRCRRVVRRRARRGRAAGRAISSQHITDLVRPHGRPCRAPVPPSRVAAFAYGGRPGHRHWRSASPGQRHREPDPGMANDPGAGPPYRRGDFRGGRVRQDLRLYAPVRAATGRLWTHASSAARCWPATCPPAPTRRSPAPAA